MLRWATFAAFILAVDGFSAPGPMLGLRHRSSGAASVRMVASPLDMEDEKMGWWDAPRRIVASDGGMRAKGLYYWLLDEHNVDLSRVELKQSELEGLGIFAKDVWKASCTPPPEHLCLFLSHSHSHSRSLHHPLSLLRPSFCRIKQDAGQQEKDTDDGINTAQSIGQT
jgi:hypothetical protein